MQVIRGIDKPLPGERPLQVEPPLVPYVRPEAGAQPLRRRLNLFAQRALTHVALTQEQKVRMLDAELLAQAVAPGVIDGLEVALEVGRVKTFVFVSPGHALSSEGLDLELAYPLRCDPDAIPLHGPTLAGWLQSSDPAELKQAVADDHVFFRDVLVPTSGGTRGELRSGLLPHAMVLVAQPVTVALGGATGDVAVCDNATDDTATADLAWEDGFRLVWVPWPADRPLPLWSEDGQTVESRFRNRLAYAIFDDERRPTQYEGVRSVRRMTETRSPDDPPPPRRRGEAPLPPLQAPWPWEAVGVPLSIVGFDAQFHPVFADRAAVVRQGGGPRNRAPLVHLSGEDVMWQARVAQMLEHVAELPPDGRTANQLVTQFERLPPAGLLPRDAVDFDTKRQTFFPPAFDVQAQPVPLDVVDTLLAESASLASLDLSGTEQVQVLVPVPARYYEKDLLNLDERINPLFDLEIRRLEADRLRLLKRRDALRRRMDLLARAITGELPAYAEDDPNALADERGAQDAMAFSRVRVVRVPGAGITHYHGFANAQARLALTAADTLFVFAQVTRADATLMLKVQRQQDGTLQETIFYWGALQPNAPTNMVRVGPLPTGENGQVPTNAWMRLDLPVALGTRQSSAGPLPNPLLTAPLDNLQFGVLSGAAGLDVRWGYAGMVSSGTERYWVADAFPPGASIRNNSGATVLWEGLGNVLTPEEEQGIGVVTGDGTVFSVQELDSLVARHQSAAGGLARELGLPWSRAEWTASGGTTGRNTRAATVLASPQRPLIEQGLNALIERLGQRIAAGDDHVEVGFLRARTDIFRLRQGVLGTTLAGRLLTSPAAAELVQRSETAVATDKVFADYFERVNKLQAS
jgi:hypothetical protein